MLLGRRTLLPCAIAMCLTLGCSDPGGNEEPTGQVLFVGLTGAPDPPRMSIGEEGYLHAVTYDHSHQIITDVPIRWSTSNAAVATVEVQFGDSSWARFVASGPGTATITATSDGAHASMQLTVIIMPVASVVVTPDSAGSMVGMANALTATLYDSLGRVLTDRQVTWMSSNPGVARVSPGGLVTATGSGTATITATSEGKSDHATIVTVPRPTADWGAVNQDWTTFEGNAGHTGFVPATVDPVVFARRWELVAEANTALNPVATGAGLVFASTLAYFGEQKLHVFDAANGARVWSHDFGDIHSVNPPAFSNGAVYLSTGGHQDSFLWSFQAANGQQRFKAPYENQWSRSGAPVIMGSSVYMSGGYYGGMYAFSSGDGAQQWFSQSVWEDGVNPAAAGGLLYTWYGPGSGGLSALDGGTGAPVFDIASPTSGSLTLTPAGHVVSAQGDGSLTSFDLTSRTVAWSIPGSFRGPVVVANNVLYVLNNASVEARSEGSGALLWSWTVPGELGYGLRTMVITNNILFAGFGVSTYAIDLAAHVPVWSYPAGGSLALSREGLLLIAQGDGTLTGISIR